MTWSSAYCSRLQNKNASIDPSLSDHPFIYFRCRLAPGRPSSVPAGIPRPRKILLPPIESIDGPRFCTALSNALRAQPALLHDSEDLELSVMHLATEVQRAARRCGSMRNVRKEFKKKMPWWSRELWGMRNRLRSAYNKAKEDLRNSAQSPAVNSYRHLKSEYQRELRRAEQSSFRKFSSDLNDDLGAALKAIQADNLPAGGFPSRLIINGEELSNPTDILTAFGEHFFPPDPPTEEVHQLIVDAADAATCHISNAQDLAVLMIESEIPVVLVLFSNAFDFLLCGDIFARSENAEVMVKLVNTSLGI